MFIAEWDLSKDKPPLFRVIRTLRCGIVIATNVHEVANRDQNPVEFLRNEIHLTLQKYDRDINAHTVNCDLHFHRTRCDGKYDQVGRIFRIQHIGGGQYPHEGKQGYIAEQMEISSPVGIWYKVIYFDGIPFQSISTTAECYWVPTAAIYSKIADS